MDAEVARQRLLAAIPLTRRRLQLAGVSTSVLVGGEGPPVVLLHGPGEFAAKWLWVVPELVGSHRLIVPDLPGHGGSEVHGSADADAALDGDQLVAWLGALIDRTCLAPPTLVGHGVALAARFAVDHSARLSGLVLVDSLGLERFEPAPEFESALTAFGADPRDDTYEALWRHCAFDLDRLRRRMGDRWALFRTYNVQQARTASTQAAMEVLIDELGTPIAPSDLRRISVPTTLIWGRQDLATPLSIAERAADHYGWGLQVIEDAADDPAMEQPEAFCTALSAAIEGVPQAEPRP
jgi:pimeloyl-ACP methyl ester carboxylesterase